MQIESPLHTVDFLDDFQKILGNKFTATTVEECIDSAGNPAGPDFFGVLTGEQRTFCTVGQICEVICQKQVEAKRDVPAD